MLRTAGRFAFVDDEKLYLDSLALTLPSDVGASYFLAPGQIPRLEASLERTRLLLASEAASLDEIYRVQSERNPAAALALKFFANPERLQMYIGLFTDYAMPVEDGLSLSRRYAFPGLQRTLLTGMADEHLAIEAFNADAINRYIPKHSPGLRGRLIEQFAHQAQVSGDRRAEVLRRAIEPAFAQALAAPWAREKLSELLARYGIVEYMVLGVPQGLVGITAQGRALWVQMETADSFTTMLELAEEDGWDPQVRRRLKARKSIVSGEFMTQLSKRPEEKDAHELSPEPALYGAVFGISTLPSDMTPVIRERQPA